MTYFRRFIFLITYPIALVLCLFIFVLGIFLAPIRYIFKGDYNIPNVIIRCVNLIGSIVESIDCDD